MAPEMPEGARLDGRGPTVLRELGLFVPLALSAIASVTGVSRPKATAWVAVSVVCSASRILGIRGSASSPTSG